MIYLRCLFVVIFSLQLSTKNVLSAPNVKDDAQDALNLLSEEINSTTKIVTEDIPNTWNANINSTNKIVLQDLTNDFGNFTFLLNNLTGFVNNVSERLNCVNDILSANINGLKDSDNSSNIFIEIFSNIFSLAEVEIGRVVKQFKELDAEFTSNCVEDNINCDGVSSYVIAEVERLVQVLKRIRIDFLAEVHVLGYKYVVTWKSSRVLLITELNNRLKNATTCLASKIEDYALGVSSASVVGSPNNVKDSISDILYDLVQLARVSYESSLEIVTDYAYNFTEHTNNSYTDTITEISSAIFRANQTINLLYNIAPEFNSTLGCALPNLHDIVNSSVDRALEEYTNLGKFAISASYYESMDIFDENLLEVIDLTLQLPGCKEGANCDYLLETIARKSIEVPVTFGTVGNSTSVLMFPTAFSVRESGARIVRDVLEKLEASIGGLKSCIRYNLY